MTAVLDVSACPVVIPNIHNKVISQWDFVTLDKSCEFLEINSVCSVHGRMTGFGRTSPEMKLIMIASSIESKGQTRVNCLSRPK